MPSAEPEAARMRRALGELRGVTEKRMFGGICFLLHDHMLCGTSKHRFMFRVGKEQESEALARPGAMPMEMNGRRFRGFVWVDGSECTDRDLSGWVTLAQGYVAGLPPKETRSVQGTAATRRTAVRASGRRGRGPGTSRPQ